MGKGRIRRDELSYMTSCVEDGRAPSIIQNLANIPSQESKSIIGT